MLSGGLRIKEITKQSQENMPLITVVTVVRNGEKTLEETILSVINQTYENVEYIVVDGASTDGTLEIIKKYEDKIDYWMSEPDKGIYDAMNKGIDLATGEWINFMNSGDGFYEIDTITRVIPYFVSENDISIFYGDTLLCFETGMYIMKAPNVIHKLNKMSFYHQSTFTQTSLLKKYHFKMQYEIVADYAFFLNAYNIQKKFLHIPIVISKYDTTGVSSNSKNLLKHLYERYSVNGFLSKKINKFLFCFILFSSILKEFIRKHAPYLLKHYRKLKFGRKNTYE